MKRISLIALLLFAASGLFAQKPKVSSAETLLTTGTIDKAKTDIDAATENDATKNWYKTWFVRGMVYQHIHEDQSGIYKKLDPDALNKAYDAYIKALELGKKEQDDAYASYVEKKKAKGKEATKKREEFIFKDEAKINKMLYVDPKTGSIKNDFIMEGVAKYNAKEYAEALGPFEKSLEIDKRVKLPYIDTSIVYQTAITAHLCKDYKKALKYYEIAAKHEYLGADTYRNRCSVIKAMGDTVKALEVLNAGLKKYPGDKELMLALTDHYIQIGETEKALQPLDEAIKKEPTNARFHYIKGALCEQIAASEITKYKKALEGSIATLEEELVGEKAKFKATKNTKERSSILNRQSEIKDEINALKEKPSKPSSQVVKDYKAKSIECYKKAIELNPELGDAHYNLGVVYYNEAVVLFKDADDIPPSETDKYNAKKEEATNELKKALPYIKKAHEVNPTDRTSLQTLRGIYMKLGDKEKVKEIKAQLEKL